MQETLYHAKIHVQSPEDFPSSYKCILSLKNNTLQILLISTATLFTFHICTISPTDFSVTKREQGIKVDFDRFVRTIVQFFGSLEDGTMSGIIYLNNKDHSNNINNRENKDLSFRFVFMENNSFKNVPRLELIFYKPDENEFRRYLSDTISRIETDNYKLSKENKTIKEITAQKEKEIKYKLKALESDYESLRNDYNKIYKENCVIEEESSKYKKEIEDYEKKIIDLERKINEMEIDKEKNRMSEMKMERNKELISELEEKVENLKDENKEKDKIIRKMKEEIKDYKSKKDENDVFIDEVRDELKKFKKEKEEKNKKIKGMEEMIKDLEKEVNEKDKIIKEMKSENSNLGKRLENAQSVYNYFHNKKVEQENKDSNESSMFSSIQPESPPR